MCVSRWCLLGLNHATHIDRRAKRINHMQHNRKRVWHSYTHTLRQTAQQKKTATKAVTWQVLKTIYKLNRRYHKRARALTRHFFLNSPANSLYTEPCCVHWRELLLVRHFRRCFFRAFVRTMRDRAACNNVEVQVHRRIFWMNVFRDKEKRI